MLIFSFLFLQTEEPEIGDVYILHTLELFSLDLLMVSSYSATDILLCNQPYNIPVKHVCETLVLKIEDIKKNRRPPHL